MRAAMDPPRQPCSMPARAKRVRKRPAAVRNRDVGEYSSTAAPVTCRVRKRPAAATAAQYEGISAQSLPQTREPLPEWACTAPEGDEFPRQPWAEHIVRTLVSNGHLPRSSQKKVQLQVWSDCSGINSEKFAWNEIQDAINRIIGADVSLMLYYTCESEAKSLVFAKANHHPKHVGSNMSQRNFARGVFWCTMHEENFPIPQSGVDLYVGTYPCSPWSRRGPRTGWDHPSVEAFRIGIQSLSYMQPAVWIIEMGELPENASLDDILSEIQSMLSQDNRQYIIQVVRSLGPQSQGYPIKRTRTYFLGWRDDVAPLVEVAQPLHNLISSPIDVTSSYRGFLKIAHPYDWSGVGTFLVGADLEFLSRSACCCSCNPYVLCPVHRCKCDKCGPDGLQCKWRSRLRQLLGKEGLSSQAGSMDGEDVLHQRFGDSRGRSTHAAESPYFVEYYCLAAWKPAAAGYSHVGGQIAESTFRIMAHGWNGADIDDDFTIVVNVGRKRASSLGVGCADGFRHEQDGTTRPDRSLVSQTAGFGRACAQFRVSLGSSFGAPLAGTLGHAIVTASHIVVAVAREYSLATSPARAGCSSRCSGVLLGNIASKGGGSQGEGSTEKPWSAVG